jgi:E3 ubiquitin-protein ligase synoviolin
MVRFGRYAAVSAVGATGAVFHAFNSREQFYPAMLYLATSKVSLVLLLNMALVIICALWQLVKAVFLGPLREIEVERLNEQLWREVMEILFAMTVFRDEFNVSFVTSIIVLLFIKAFHWLAQTRVEYIETTPSVSRLSHARIVSFMLVLLTMDCLLFNQSFSHLLKTRKASVSLFFAFE